MTFKKYYLETFVCVRVVCVCVCVCVRVCVSTREHGEASQDFALGRDGERIAVANSRHRHHAPPRRRKN